MSRNFVSPEEIPLLRWQDDVNADRVTLVNSNNSNIDVQNPLPVDGDSIYAKDIWIEECDLNNFSGVVTDLFDNLHTTCTDSTSGNPKIFRINFKRTLYSNTLGLGSHIGNFSNMVIKVILSGNETITVFDDRTNNTKYTTRTLRLPITTGINALQFEFYTSDPVSVSNLVILKIRSMVSRLQANDKESVVQDINCNLSIDGNYHLNVSTIQNAYYDENNSSVINLTSANTYTFSGSATETISSNAIQTILKTDQNAYIYVDQSSDGTNWDITDIYTYYYSKGGFSKTIKSVGDYYRIRVQLINNIDTTYFRLKTKLIPISETLPSSLDRYDRLKTTTGIINLETEKIVEIESLGSLKTISPVRLIGTPFNNGTKDPSFWFETVTGSATVTQSGQIILSTGTTANSSSRYETISKARKVTGTTNQFRMVGRLMTIPQENNIRRTGCFNDNDGFFFQVDGEIFGVGSRKNGIDTVVVDGFFNGNFGNSVNIGITTNRFVIEYTSVSAKFFINEKLLHTLTSPYEPLTNTLDLPIRMENYNINGNTTNNSFQLRFAVILRLGELVTNPIYKYIGTNTTTICKYSSGVLQRINITDNSGTLVIYDNTIATGTIIASIDAAKTVGTLEFNAPFSNGLTIVSAGNAKCTVIYE